MRAPALTFRIKLLDTYTYFVDWILFLIFFQAIIVIFETLYVRINRPQVALGQSKYILIQAVKIVLASIQLLLYTVQSIDLSELRLQAVIRYKRPYKIVDRPLDTERSTTNVIIDIVRTLTGKGEVVIIADDIFNKLFTTSSPPIDRRLPVHLGNVYLVEYIVNFSRYKLTLLFKSIR